ncbi:hypothetical protein BC835DRAFT_1250855, partial [Cytidiella melzeri]
LLRPFDVSTRKEADNTRNATEASLRELAAGLDVEEASMTGPDIEAGMEDSIEGGIDDVEGWYDEVQELSERERDELDETVQPVKFVLVKLRKLSFSIIHSSTILLPAWHDLLKRLKLAKRQMPRDVRTRWNSTFTMLNFAVKYREAIAEFTSSLRTNMRKYELNDDEWEIVEQLRDVLKV